MDGLKPIVDIQAHDPEGLTWERMEVILGLLSARLDDHVIGELHMPLPVINAARVVDGRFAVFRDYYDLKMVKEQGMGLTELVPRTH